MLCAVSFGDNAEFPPLPLWPSSPWQLAQTWSALSLPAATASLALAAKLDAMDRRSASGAWTRDVLALIDRKPKTAASKLSPELGRERLAFKADVRKLKRLGLTLACDVGYEISPRGAAYLAAAHPSKRRRTRRR